MAEKVPTVSIVIPVHNEKGNIGPLLAEIAQAFPSDLSHEVLVVDDASTDASLEETRAAGGHIRIFRHRRRAGKSAAILTGARRARAPWIALLDGDGQNDPRDLARIAEALVDGEIEADLVRGRRIRRHDGWGKQVSSRMANWLQSRLFGDPTSDRGCGVSVIRRDILLRIPPFSTMHRFLPALVLREGGSVEETDVVDRPRQQGQSKYGILDRILVTVPDLFGMLWLRRRTCAVPLVDEDESERHSPGPFTS